MDQQNIETSGNSVNMAQFDIDELSFDDMDFKPVTQGLGFHHEEKKQAYKKVNTVSRGVSPAIQSTSMQTSNLGISNPDNQKHISKNSTSMEGLDAFYGNNTKSSQPIEVQAVQEVEIEEKEYELATKASQFGAWIVDLLLVTLTVVVTTALLALVSGIKLQVLMKLVSPKDMIIFIGSLFTIFYLLYFTILDLATSPGKSLMGITLVKEDNSDVRVLNTFNRSLITLLSMITVGLPCLIDFQGKLSDTKVVKS